MWRRLPTRFAAQHVFATRATQGANTLGRRILPRRQSPTQPDKRCPCVANVGDCSQRCTRNVCAGREYQLLLAGQTAGLPVIPKRNCNCVERLLCTAQLPPNPGVPIGNLRKRPVGIRCRVLCYTRGLVGANPHRSNVLDAVSILQWSRHVETFRETPVRLPHPRMFAAFRVFVSCRAPPATLKVLGVGT